MTAQEIADAYRTRAPSPRRLEKAKALAVRMKVDWREVEPLLKAEP